MASAETSSNSSEKKVNDNVVHSRDIINGDTRIESDPIFEVQEETTFITGLPLALTLAGTGLAILLTSLDKTIVATAIPTITDDFHSINDISWYATAYMITNCASQLIFGKIYKFYSTKTVFLLSFGIFEVGSAICGSAPNSIALILGRAIAGVGQSGIVAGSMMILVHVSPLHKRPLYAAILAAAVGVASILGPVLGGLFTTHLSWKWCFYINLPIGAVSMPIIAFCLKTPPPTNTKLTLLEQVAKLDPLGTICFIPSIVCLVLALQWGGTTYAWSDGKVIACLVMFAVFVIAFIIVQIWLGDQATVPPRIIKQRSIASGAWLMICGGGSLYILSYYLPLWFQAVKGVDAAESGIRILPTVIALILGAFFGAFVTKKSGFYVPAVIGSAVIAPIGMGLISTFKPNTSHQMWIGYQVLYGLGFGMSMQVAQLLVQAVLDKDDVSTGTAIMFFSQQLGSIVFIAISQNIFLDDLVKNLGKIANLDPSLIVETGATNFKTVVPDGDLVAVIQVYNDALVKTFYVSLACICGLVLSAVTMQWQSIKKTGKVQDMQK